MSRKIKGNGKHLTFSDRIYIEQELMQGSSFRDIAASLGKDPSTISKEIRLHCTVAPNGTYRFPHCTACYKLYTQLSFYKKEEQLLSHNHHFKFVTLSMSQFQNNLFTHLFCKLNILTSQYIQNGPKFTLRSVYSIASELRI